MACEEKAKKWDETQERLTKLADRLEKSEIFIHRTLEDLPEDYVSTVSDYLAAEARSIQRRQTAEFWEKKYREALGQIFDIEYELASTQYAGERKP